MRRIVTFIVMTLLLSGFVACKQDDKATPKGFQWIVDCFDDVKVLRYQVPGFDSLSLNDKLYIYYLNQAALCGRDILFDQNCRFNLPIRRTLETIYQGYPGDRKNDQFRAFEKYLKKVWFANGIHHHYATDKFIPAFSEEYFDHLVRTTPQEVFSKEYGSVEALIDTIKPVMFDPALYAKRVNQTADEDLIVTSANNYYEGVTQQEVEDFYAAMANPNDRQPISYGLNSKLIKEDGIIYERVWKVGGMYSPAIEKIIFWLEKAASVGSVSQKEQINTLISYYKSGDLRLFDRYSVLWVQDTASKVDFVNGFIETYGDPIGYRASWESIVNFKDEEATKRTEVITANAQWFEDHSPINDAFKKAQVKGVSAKVITVAMLGGDCYPPTPIGINLPNADWIRKEYGSKSVTIQNITHAYSEAAKGNGFNEEFILNPEDIELKKKFGSLGDDLHTDLHECLGHGSGQLAPGVRGDELRNYASTLEETRADLFALYYLADSKLVDLQLVPSQDVARSEYLSYITNGLMTQLARIELGKDIEESHMRNRHLIAQWCYEQGAENNVIELVKKNGKTYVAINDYNRLRQLFGKLLYEVQRIKSEGDFEAGKALVETYAVKVDQELHAEVKERYERLNIEPYSGFINPSYTPVMENGEIVDVNIKYQDSYVDQMLEYSKEYSYLPTRN